MADLKLSLIFSAVDRMTRPMRVITGSAKKTQSQLGRLTHQRKGIRTLGDLTRTLGKTASGLDKAKRRTADLGRQLSRTETPSKRLTKRFDQARRVSDRLKLAHRKQRGEVRQLRGELRGAGIDTRRLGAAQSRLDDQIERTTRRLTRQKNRLQRWRTFKAGIPGVARKAAVGLGVLGVAGELFRRTFLNTAIDFERFQTILETTEGSSAKAKSAMDWISNFAVKTPFELDQVTDSFVKLRAYGLDPTQGLLRTLGDTSSAMGKGLMQAVEAIADAVTGENERLKEFGVKARTKGDTITYEYTVNGETRTAQANARDRAEIERVLTGIFDSKFGGASEKRAATFEGMLSNLGDQWVRFQLIVMGSGLFDRFKGWLSGILDTIDRMAASGALERIGLQVGEKLTTFFEKAWSFGQQVLPVILNLASAADRVASAVGGWGNVIHLLLGLKVGGVIAKLFGVGNALKWVGVVLKFIASAALTNPIGLAITGIVVGTLLIYKYWEPIKGFFSGLWEGVKSIFSTAWEGITSLLTGTWDRIKPFFGGLGGRIIRTIVDGLTGAAGWLWSALKGVLGRVAKLLPFSDAREGPLSRLTAAGGSILGTLGQGLQRSGPAALRHPLARALIAATAGLALTVPVTPAAGTVPDTTRPAAVRPGPVPLSFDPRPREVPRAAGPTPTVIHYHNRIIIHQQPGEDANTLADRILRRIEERSQRRLRGAATDDI